MIKAPDRRHTVQLINEAQEEPERLARKPVTPWASAGARISAGFRAGA